MRCFICTKTMVLFIYLFIKLEVLRGGFVVLRLEVSILSRDSTYNSLRQNQDYLAFYTLFLTNKAKSINQITKWPPSRPHLSKYEMNVLIRTDATESDEQMFICIYVVGIIWNCAIFYYSFSSHALTKYILDFKSNIGIQKRCQIMH